MILLNGGHCSAIHRHVFLREPSKELTEPLGSAEPGLKNIPLDVIAIITDFVKLIDTIKFNQILKFICLLRVFIVN